MLPLQIEDRTQKHKIQAQKTNKGKRIGSSTTPICCQFKLATEKTSDNLLRYLWLHSLKKERRMQTLYFSLFSRRDDLILNENHVTCLLLFQDVNHLACNLDQKMWHKHKGFRLERPQFSSMRDRNIYSSTRIDVLKFIIRLNSGCRCWDVRGHMLGGLQLWGLKQKVILLLW